jgi:glycosyltransferase involved in cell wall biosynthesis
MTYPRVAFVHDWLIDKGGSENVLAAMLDLWPEAPIFTLFHQPNGSCQAFLAERSIHTSFLQKIPGAIRHYRNFFPLMPLAIEQFDLSGYDLVISSSHAVAKGVLIGPDQLHLSYVHSPIRYAWDLQHEYMRNTGLTRGIQAWVARIFLHYLRLWDMRTANGVDFFVANSQFIARRIWKVYRRDATVIYPPVDVDKFSIGPKKENFYLTASRLVSYKRVDLIVKAFSAMPEKQLVVIGSGPDFNKIRVNAGSNVHMIGYQNDSLLCDYLQRARAFIFAAREDFGITPLEAQACGTPVIAYGKGGALETVIDGETGLFFAEQTVESLCSAVREFESGEYHFDPMVLRNNANRFSKAHFQGEFKNFVELAWQAHQPKEFVHRKTNG